jgi:hypothetical protein
MHNNQKHCRATKTEIALRGSEALCLRVGQGMTNRQIAAELGISDRQVQRAFADLRDRRAAPNGEKAVFCFEMLSTKYSWLHREARALRKLALQQFGVLSAEYSELDRLCSEVDRAWIELAKAVSAPPVEEARDEDLRVKGSNNLIHRLSHALDYYSPAPGVIEELAAVIARFGRQAEIPLCSSGVARDLRMTLLYGTTDFTLEEVGAAFGRSYKTVSRSLEKIHAKYPEAAGWGAGIGAALEAYERQYVVLQAQCSASGATVSHLQDMLSMVKLSGETLLMLGALPHPKYDAYLVRRAELLAAVSEICLRFRLADDGRERVTLIVTAWADRRRLPSGVAPLPPRHKKLEEVSPFRLVSDAAALEARNI